MGSDSRVSPAQKHLEYYAATSTAWRRRQATPPMPTKALTNSSIAGGIGVVATVIVMPPYWPLQPQSPKPIRSKY